ncbi:Lysine--tRNA ligase [Parasphaerochaeta coccoides DSM 17374]|uniref:Lysine--tRNA ligase n=2 Tax=Parasphaerochaeta TaxID=3062336 RepID=F4GM67_PARC1|nr:Lysine--tRNA ligase [Parasphaerochaeta coccoides DSM 17374]
MISTCQTSTTARIVMPMTKAFAIGSSRFNFQAAKQRSRLLKAMRSWFDSHGYLEVDTPLLSPDLIPEPTIHTFATTFSHEFLGSREFYLVPSPEVFMKKLLAAGSGSIYQFSHCFRNNEQIGSHHNPEFTMLEYYTLDADEQDSMALTEELLAATAPKNCPDHLLPPFRKMSMAAACHAYAGIDLEKNQDVRDLRRAALRLGLSLPEEPESWEDTFNRIFLTFVEPSLPQDKPLVLDKYPIQIECLAAEDETGPWRKRWEMYAGGVELANCYDEMRDAQKIRAYYRKEYAKLSTERSQNGAVIPDADLSFADIFTKDFPRCSGVAMGMDRLLMLQTGITSLKGVILFPFPAMLGDG